MSSRTISGRSTATASTAPTPSAASPTMSKPSAWSNARAEARKAAWSSTINTVGRMPLIVPQAHQGTHCGQHQYRAIGSFRGCVFSVAGPGNAHRSTGSKTVANHTHMLKPPRMFRPADGPKLLTGQANVQRKGVEYGQGPPSQGPGP